MWPQWLHQQSLVHRTGTRASLFGRTQVPRAPLRSAMSPAGDTTMLRGATLSNSVAIERRNARFEQTVLLLQGGGALGSYQAGAHQALAERTCIRTGWQASRSARSTRP